MIARIWHGRTKRLVADEYVVFLERRAVPDYQRISGNCGVYIFRRFDGDEAHFEVLTLWDSLHAIEQFAGEDVTRAKYYPEDGNFLLEFEPRVQHFEAYATLPTREAT